MKKLLVVPIFALCMVFAGCNAQATAQKAQQIISAVLQTAQAEEPAVPAQDQATFTNFVNLGLTLNGQLGTCIGNVGGLMGKGAKFESCFNTFAQGLFSSSELDQLRVLSPASAAKVQLYATAIIAGVNVVVSFASPSVATAPSSAEMRSLGHRVGLTDRELAYAGY